MITTEKKSMQEMLTKIYSTIGIDQPSNNDEILDFVENDVKETADPENWHSGDVATAFRRFIENVSKPLNSISWAVEDFEHRAAENFEFQGEFYNEKRVDSWEQVYDKSKFSEALSLMIHQHDCNVGISWDTIDVYLADCKR